MRKEDFDAAWDIRHDINYLEEIIDKWNDEAENLIIRKADISQSTRTLVSEALSRLIQDLEEDFNSL